MFVLNATKKNRFLLPLLPLMVVAAAGFIASVIIHVGVRLNWQLRLTNVVFYSFHAVVLAVGCPTGWLLRRLMANQGKHAFWKLILCCCPRWMSAIIVLLAGYHVADLLVASEMPVQPLASEGRVPVETWRMFSAAWMAAFAAVFAMLYSVVAIEQYKCERTMT